MGACLPPLMFAILLKHFASAFAPAVVRVRYDAQLSEHRGASLRQRWRSGPGCFLPFPIHRGQVRRSRVAPRRKHPVALASASTHRSPSPARKASRRSLACPCQSRCGSPGFPYGRSRCCQGDSEQASETWLRLRACFTSLRCARRLEEKRQCQLSADKQTRQSV
jgi:hypothetical protein